MSKEKKPVTTMSIMQFPIGHPQNDVFIYVRTDRELVDAACRYADKLRQQNVEIFERRGNVLATEKGYFAVLFEEEIRSIPGNIDNPTPFIGKDKRVKIDVVKEDGTKVVEDLATLVAQKFVPNFHHKTRIGFKDYNRGNCQANNLIFISKFKYWWLNLTKYKTVMP